MDRPVKTIDISKAAELYNKRFNEFGRNIKTVGWGSGKDQYLRFEVLFRGLDIRGKKIADIGCGLGDLVPFLRERAGDDFSYLGVDIADKLIQDAQNTHSGENIQFVTGDIFSANLADIDIAVMSGALSFKIDGIEEYAYAVMARMFELSGEACSLNFLTKYVDFELDKNQHYHPEKLFAKAKELSKNVNLIHDYPLYEFTVQLIR
jgi:ubiquinone/menaquinone biosynthesis C-methylase UbiE